MVQELYSGTQAAGHGPNYPYTDELMGTTVKIAVYNGSPNGREEVPGENERKSRYRPPSPLQSTDITLLANH